jgi:hypothetical protein
MRLAAVAAAAWPVVLQHGLQGFQAQCRPDCRLARHGVAEQGGGGLQRLAGAFEFA